MAALYLHVPFREPPTASEASAFVAAAVREMEHSARAPFAEAPVRALYVGGGRPSLLSDSAIQTLVEALHRTFDVAPGAEVTLELHSSDASPSFLAALRRADITRLSITPGSAPDEEGFRTLRDARTAGFERISVDLLADDAGRLSAWKARLHQAVAHRVPHLTLHEDDPPPSRGNEDQRADRLAFARTFLAAKGYEQYELTHFARPGHRSRYQTHVYAHDNVLGLGPGAESFWWPDRSAPATASRWSNVADLATYVERLRDERSPIAHRQDLDRETLAREYILLRLRTNDGLALDLLTDRYGVALRDRHGATLDRLVDEGLLHDDPDRVRLTPRGRLLTDAITRRLMQDL